MVNSINKGKGFEREIANYLTYITNVKWHRVPMSGAFSTNNNSEDPRFDGDVFTEDEKYIDYVIECKSYEKLEINELFNENSKFYKWIKQSQDESKGKKWILFIKIKNKGIFLVSNTYNDFIRENYFGQKFIIIEKYMMIKIK